MKLFGRIACVSLADQIKNENIANVLVTNKNKTGGIGILC